MTPEDHATRAQMPAARPARPLAQEGDRCHPLSFSQPTNASPSPRTPPYRLQVPLVSHCRTTPFRLSRKERAEIKQHQMPPTVNHPHVHDRGHARKNGEIADIVCDSSDARVVSPSRNEN